MRKLAMSLVIGLLCVSTTSILAADPDPTSGGVAAPLMDGQSLADALMEWDGYDFTDAGDAWPGALRSGPSSASDPDDPYGGDSTIWILPPLDGPAHVLVEARLSDTAEPIVWGNVQRIMSELGFTQDEQRGVYGGFGQVLGAAYANASDDDRSNDAVAWIANAVALWASRTQGFEPVQDGQPEPLVPMPRGGIQLEIVPTGEQSAVLPMPEPTLAPTPEPTPEPTETPRPTRTPRPTPKATKTPSPTAAAGEAPAPGKDDWICDQSDDIIGDPFNSNWNVARVDWGKRNGFDRIKITLDRRSGEADFVQAIAHQLPIDDVANLKVKKPSAGGVAVAVGLFEGVRLTWTIDRQLSGLNAVRAITLGKDNNGFAWLVVGADGEGCYSLQVPAWTAHHPEEDARVVVFLDVKKP